MKPTHADQKYIEALLNNDVVLIKEIYQKWGPEVRNFVIKNSGQANDAKDIFQETIVAVLLKVRKGNFRLVAPLGGYLYHVYRAKWFNELSKKKKEPVTIKDISRYINETEAIQLAEETILLELRSNVLKACFVKISELCQKVLNEKYGKNLKAINIMQQLQLPSVGAVNKKMFDCREGLRKLIIKHPSFKDLNY